VSDPNWFYSTLAQSTAALVGLAGGFLVSRLIARREEINAERADLTALFEAFVQDLGSQATTLDARAAEIEAIRPDYFADWVESGQRRAGPQTFSHPPYDVGPPHAVARGTRETT
jgi:hypothetical protein